MRMALKLIIRRASRGSERAMSFPSARYKLMSRRLIARMLLKKRTAHHETSYSIMKISSNAKVSINFSIYNNHDVRIYAITVYASIAGDRNRTNLFYLIIMELSTLLISFRRFVMIHS